MGLIENITILVILLILVILVGAIFFKFNPSPDELPPPIFIGPTYSSNPKLEPLQVFLARKKRYMESVEFKTKKQELLVDRNFACEVCGCGGEHGNPLEVHHTRYTNLGNESLDDLALLCRTHHQRQHDLYGYPQTVEDYLQWDTPVL